jgi:hypothetical protein
LQAPGFSRFFSAITARPDQRSRRYNAGPREIFARIPRSGETRGYVAAVLRFFERYSTQRSRDKTAGPRGPSPANLGWLRMTALNLIEQTS